MSLKLKEKIVHRNSSPDSITWWQALTAPSHVADTNDARDTPEDNHRSLIEQRLAFKRQVETPRPGPENLRARAYTSDVDGFVVRRGLNGHGESRGTGAGTHACLCKRGATRRPCPVSRVSAMYNSERDLDSSHASRYLLVARRVAVV
jgi:hypothetical protein